MFSGQPLSSSIIVLVDACLRSITRSFWSVAKEIQNSFSIDTASVVTARGHIRSDRQRLEAHCPRGGQRNAVASLIVGAFHTAGQERRPVETRIRKPRSWKIATTNPAELLKATEAAVKESNQSLACALAQKYGETGQSARCLTFS